MKLLEEKRNELVTKSKSSNKGLQRYKRRVKSKVSSSTKEYNQINMDKLFKEDILDILISVKGETDNYDVKISFGGVLDLLQKEINRLNKLDLSQIVKAVVNAFNRNDVYVWCSCDDFKYRFAYWVTKNKYSSGGTQNTPAKITNPHDRLGSGCKHILLVLGNTVWILKVASVINNYIKYMSKFKQELYAEYIYPKLYGKEYEEPVQQSMFNDDIEDIDVGTSNEVGSKIGRGRKNVYN